MVLVLVSTGNLRMGFREGASIKWIETCANAKLALARGHYLNPTRSRTENKRHVKDARKVIKGNTHILECLFILGFTNFVEKTIVFVTVISFIQDFGLRLLIPRDHDVISAT